MFSSEKRMKIKSYRWNYDLKRVTSLTTNMESEINEGDIILIDKNVASLYENLFYNLLAKHKHRFIEATEHEKSYQQLEPIIEWLIKTGFRKNNRLIAIGGGIVQDICAFISSILFRGVQWIFIPSSLLAQCDSCIGSKTSINFGPYKNQIGNFHPPVLILIYNGFLETLPREEIRSGIGEMMHYFLISGKEDMDLISNNYDKALINPETLTELIDRSLEIKKEMIEVDEFDSGPRNIFNYGHSFGHALESYSNYSIPHGIAVSFGMDIANELSFKLGLMQEKDTIAIREVLRKNWWPCDLPDIDVEAFIKVLAKDKKNTGETLRFVLSRGVGNMFLSRVNNDDLLRSVLVERFESYKKEKVEYEAR